MGLLAIHRDTLYYYGRFIAYFLSLKLYICLKIHIEKHENEIEHMMTMDSDREKHSSNIDSLVVLRQAKRWVGTRGCNGVSNQLRDLGIQSTPMPQRRCCVPASSPWRHYSIVRSRVALASNDIP